MNVFKMKFAKVFPMLIAKAERKGRTREEVYELKEWLTGYSSDDIDHVLNSDTTYGEFFDRAPRMNLARMNVSAIFCLPNIDSYFTLQRYTFLLRRWHKIIVPRVI